MGGTAGERNRIDGEITRPLHRDSVCRHDSAAPIPRVRGRCCAAASALFGFDSGVPTRPFGALRRVHGSKLAVRSFCPAHSARKQGKSLLFYRLSHDLKTKLLANRDSQNFGVYIFTSRDLAYTRKPYAACGPRQVCDFVATQISLRPRSPYDLGFFAVQVSLRSKSWEEERIHARATPNDENVSGKAQQNGAGISSRALALLVFSGYDARSPHRVASPSRVKTPSAWSQ